MPSRFDPQKAKAAADAARLGMVPREKLALMEFGSVWVAKDRVIEIPDHRLPSAGKRDFHEGRFVIIVQASTITRMSSCRTIQIVPCTASSEITMPWDLDIPVDEQAFTLERVVALCRLCQPILKVELVQHKGHLSPETTGKLKAKLANQFDLTFLPRAPTAPAHRRPAPLSPGAPSGRATRSENVGYSPCRWSSCLCRA